MSERRCTSSCDGGRHSTACLFAALVELPAARPVEPMDWTMPFNVVTHPGLPPGIMLIGSSPRRPGDEAGPLLLMRVGEEVTPA